MRIRLESAKRIGRKIGLNEEKGFAVAIFLALLIVSATVVGYYVWLRPQQNHITPFTCWMLKIKPLITRKF